MEAVPSECRSHVRKRQSRAISDLSMVRRTSLARGCGRPRPGLGVWECGGDAGRDYGLGFFEALADGQVQFEKLSQQIIFDGKPVGGLTAAARCGNIPL